jgi:alkylhydroperoxidase/carboxymuconolactone decarboxylase family protein YurZ
MEKSTKDEIREVKGFLPKAIKFADEINEDFAEGIAEFYQAIWDERENGLSMKEKHILVFTVACASNNVESASKILERLKKFGATRTEIYDAMMMAAWTGGIQNFTNVSSELIDKINKLGFE